MKSQGKHHFIRGLSLERGPGERGPIPGQGPSDQETQKRKAPTKSGITGLAYLRSMGGHGSRGWGRNPTTRQRRPSR